jgi:hypothetical protein
MHNACNQVRFDLIYGLAYSTQDQWFLKHGTRFLVQHGAFVSRLLVTMSKLHTFFHIRILLTRVLEEEEAEVRWLYICYVRARILLVSGGVHISMICGF